MYNLVGILLIGCFVFNMTAAKVMLEDEAQEIWRSSEFINDPSIRPARVEFRQEMIDDLKLRLKMGPKVTPPLEGTTFEYGFNTNILDFWIDYWSNKYNFTAQEEYFNQFPQYKTNIQGLDIHFIRVKPQVDCKIVPLLMLHGFPGSIREFYRSIPMLTAGCTNGIAVEVIAPCLPGFGLSDGATRSGFGPAEISTVLVNLMKRLGHNKFYLQAGDWGALIGSVMITTRPENVLGFHANFAVSLSPLTIATWCAASSNLSLIADPALESRMIPFFTYLKKTIAATGYLHLQATIPDTLGAAMSSSPIGCLVYMLTLYAWDTRISSLSKLSDELELFTPVEVLDNMMMYWAPKSFTTSARLYAEGFNMKTMTNGIFTNPTAVPVWTTHTKHEIIYLSQTLLKFKFTNILNSTVYDDYGHFFAMEVPEVFTESVLTAIAAFEDYYENNNQCRNEL